MSPRERTPQDPVLAATVDLIAERGVDGLNVEAVAAVSGVSKATIYRHWGSRAQLIHAALWSLQRPSVEPDTGSVRGDLIGLLEQLVDYLSNPSSGRVFSSFVDAAARDPELAVLQSEMIRTKRSAYALVIGRAIGRGELPAELDIELVTDLLMSPFIYRRVVGQSRVRRADIAPVVDTVLAGVASRSGSGNGATARAHRRSEVT
ncbi:TetR/AcrR family transcriptional regulator [Pseudofrankia sp. BMG5.37]|uniref:TetR/AcrR family transcriptional regulator n=1 Tax=Pseudofrankia sp. BMG5.37 TaxID=3050035 RepID=UPI0028951634|nr:TetR/AcrR family transcriptional regulator [Pseudofrankia sp. BMG5.37]MDT3442255.1 TetR/AcrR family transcriptional regulator [Pseudofrankia sp. BMG5.37]